MQFRWLIICVALVGAGCPAKGDEVRPPERQFYFPTGIALSPSEDVLFVANANSDLRFDSGTLLAVDVEAVASAIDGWLGAGTRPAGCAVDTQLAFTLVCDESPFVVPDQAVRIGNFATAVAVQELESTDLRLFVAVRGDPSLTWVDYAVASGELACGGSGEFPQCDDDHRLTRLQNDAARIGLTEEPFDVYVDSGNGYAIVTHLTSGTITLADAPTDGRSPVLTDAVGGLFAADPSTGVRGAVSARGRMPGSPNDRVYVTSRSEPRVQTMYIAKPEGADFASIVPADFFFLSGDPARAEDSRGIAFSADGNRSFIVNRSPPVLHIVDTSLDATSEPRNELIDAVEVCQEASNITIGDAGRGERVYLACFRDGQVWSINPTGGVIESITQVGQGPHGLVVSAQHELLFVTNFLENSLVAIDLTPGAATENRVVMRIGRAGEQSE